MRSVRAASGPYAAELRASNPKMGMPADGPICSPCSSQLARGRPIKRSSIDMRLLCSSHRNSYVNGPGGESLLPDGRVGSETISQFELVAQFRRLEVFAEVGEPLLQGQQCLSDCFCVGMGNVPPHGVGACSQAGHLAEGPPTDGAQIRGVAKAVF